MKTIVLDKSSFLKGTSLTDFTGDKGFSPSSYGFEVDRTGTTLGLLSPGRALSDVSTGLDGAVVTRTKFKVSGGSMKYYLVCSNGKIYETNYSTPTSNHTLKDTVTGVTFDTNSHALVYKDGFYVTSTTDIYYDNFAFSAPAKNWWTSVKSKTALTAGVPHKMFEFGNALYILNGNKIASWNGTTALDDAFTLPTGYIITDAEVDNDVIYLTIVKNDSSFSIYTETKIIVWNGISAATWLREVNVFTPAISAIKKADQGFIFWAGGDVYFFDGYNYQWLRHSSSPNFNKIIAFEGKIYFVDTYGISCYNTRFKIFSSPVYITNTVTVNTIDIVNLDYIDIFTTEPKMYRASSNSQSSVTFYSNRYLLPAAIIRKMIFVFSTPLATNSTYTVSLIDESGSAVKTDTISKAVDGAKSVVMRNNLSVRLNLLQLSVLFGNSANSKIEYIIIFYDNSEDYVGK